MVLGLLLLVLRREMSGSLADAILPGLTDLRSLHNLLDTLKEGSLDHTLNGVNERNFNQLDGWNVDNLLVRLDFGNMENAFSNLWKRHVIGLHGLLVDLSSLSSGIRCERVLLLHNWCRNVGCLVRGDLLLAMQVMRCWHADDLLLNLRKGCNS